MLLFQDYKIHHKDLGILGKVDRIDHRGCMAIGKLEKDEIGS